MRSKVVNKCFLAAIVRFIISRIPGLWFVNAFVCLPCTGFRSTIKKTRKFIRNSFGFHLFWLFVFPACESVAISHKTISHRTGMTVLTCSVTIVHKHMLSSCSFSLDSLCIRSGSRTFWFRSPNEICMLLLLLTHKTSYILRSFSSVYLVIVMAFFLRTGSDQQHLGHLLHGWRACECMRITFK